MTIEDIAALRSELERWQRAGEALRLTTSEHDLALGFGAWPFAVRVHDADRAEVLSVVRSAIERATERTVTLRHRASCSPQEAPRWLDTSVQIERDESGRATRLYTVSMRAEAPPAHERAGAEGAAEDALRQSERTLRELGANLPALVWVRDAASGRLVYANPSWERLLGEPPTLGESFQQLGEVVHPDDRALVQAASAKALEGISDQFVRFVDRAGRVFWYRLFAFGIRDASGAPYRVAGLAVDVTERRAAEQRIRASLQEKENLLKEIHHRVKNNLQVVSSLLHLQAMAAGTRELGALLAESQSRVSAMALVHEMLYQSPDLSHVPFASYVQRLGATLAAMYGPSCAGVTLVVDTGDVALTVDTAIPCGLLLNELLSNSLKHAYPGGASGVIRVVLAATGEGRYRLRVADDGVGLPADFEVRRRSSLGTKLVERLVEQLGGTLERRSSERGTEYDIAFQG